MQFSQHYTCKTKHHFPYTIVPAPHERKPCTKVKTIHIKVKQFQFNQEFFLTQRQVGCW